MKKELYLVICLLLFNGIIRAQNTGDIRSFKESFTSAPQPFLFSVNTLTGNTPFWSLNYSGSYGERASTPFGYNGVDQQFAVKGYLGNQFTLYANAAVGFARDGGTTSAQQAELLHDFIGGKQLLGPRIGLSLGASRDWTNVKAIFSRVTASFDAASWKFAGNLRFEKAFDKSRDDIDLVTGLGFHHRIVGQFFGGVEAVGEDLEGFWDADEAEGGAKLLVGPSINYVPPGSRFAFSVCGGPIFYATHSNVVPSEAIRDLSTLAQNGYTIRAQISFNIH